MGRCCSIGGTEQHVGLDLPSFAVPLGGGNGIWDFPRIRTSWGTFPHMLFHHAGSQMHEDSDKMSPLHSFVHCPRASRLSSLIVSLPCRALKHLSPVSFLSYGDDFLLRVIRKDSLSNKSVGRFPGKYWVGEEHFQRKECRGLTVSVSTLQPPVSSLPSPRDHSVGPVSPLSQNCGQCLQERAILS